MAAGDVNTVPFCGSCGWDAVRQNTGNVVFCDADGADLRRFGFLVFSQEQDVPEEPDVPFGDHNHDDHHHHHDDH